MMRVGIVKASFEGNIVHTCVFSHVQLVTAQSHLILNLMKFNSGDVPILLEPISHMCL